MSHFQLTCTGCGVSYPPDMSVACPVCGSTYEVAYAEAGTPGAQPPGWTGPPIPSPIHDAASFTSLGEGDTPCVDLERLGSSLGLDSLTAKLEFLNPTGSYKDRGTVVMMSVARELGIEEVVEDSSGNAGASVSAYAARAGIKAHVFAPSNAPEAKVAQIRVYGAEPHLIDGPREAATEAVLTLTFEGARGRLRVAQSEPLLRGGYQELRVRGLHADDAIAPGAHRGPGGQRLAVSRSLEGVHRAAGGRPRRLDSQAPLRAGEGRDAHRGGVHRRGLGVPKARGRSRVESPRRDPPHKDAILRVLEACGGSAVAVSDDSILEWQRRLAETEGIYCEPTSAAAFAGLADLVGSGRMGREDHVLVPVTGSGLKDAPPP